jgi:fructoselysine-6-P-deglycase FrlB-like protein
MALDMDRQIVDLLKMAMPEPLPGPVAFVGSGDSYVAGLAAHYLSSGRATCHHPADVIADHRIVDGRTVCFVSISGKTRANVLAAQAARKARLHTVAITADPSSALAKACGRIVKLNYRSAGRTAGTIGFAASVLACAWLATEGRTSCPANVGTIYRNACKSATRLAGRVGNKSVIIGGDSLFHPAAMYGALKFNEVLGARAVAYPLEDFFHAPLFGVKKDDDMVLVIGGDSKPPYALRKAGVKSFRINCKAMTTGSFLHAVFFMQHLVLHIAKRQKRKECHFLQDKKLDASSGFIY